MANLTASKKSSKSKAKKSRFEKLWDKADRLKRQNDMLSTRLEELVASAEQRIRPVEMEAARADLPLLKKLLTLGQRKSMAKWERSVLDDWIKELITSMQVFGIADDDLMDDVARYDAFRMGVELDEDDTDTPYQQMTSHLQNLQREAEAAAKKHQEEEASKFDDLQNNLDDLVDKILDERLGPPPVLPEKQTRTYDLLQDELDAELEQQRQAYQAKRDALREEILADLKEDMPDEAEHLFDDEWDDDPFANPDFDFDSEHHRSDESSATPKIDNQTFHKMFRATAAVLHPDREPDPEKRVEKQSLMAELLKARKKGDLLTVLKMYQQHTDNREAFSKADEKQLIAALTRHIEQLEEEQEEIVFQSPMHFSIYKRFYHSSKKKQNKAIDEHINDIREKMQISEEVSTTIKSLKTLKPWLESRYDHMEADIMDQMMEELTEGLNMRGDVRDCPF